MNRFVYAWVGLCSGIVATAADARPLPYVSTALTADARQPLPPAEAPPRPLPPGPPTRPDAEPVGVQAVPAHLFSLAAGDLRFVLAAAVGAEADRAVDEVVLQKPLPPRLHAYVRQALARDRALLHDLRSLVQGRNVVLPGSPGKTARTRAAELAQLAGAELERSYLADRIEARRAALGLYRAELSEGEDSWLRGWARQQVASLQAELHEARDMVGASGPGV